MTDGATLCQGHVPNIVTGPQNQQTWTARQTVAWVAWRTRQIVDKLEAADTINKLHYYWDDVLDLALAQPTLVQMHSTNIVSQQNLPTREQAASALQAAQETILAALKMGIVKATGIPLCCKPRPPQLPSTLDVSIYQPLTQRFALTWSPRRCMETIDWRYIYRNRGEWEKLGWDTLLVTSHDSTEIIVWWEIQFSIEDVVENWPGATAQASTQTVTQGRALPKEKPATIEELHAALENALEIELGKGAEQKNGEDRRARVKRLIVENLAPRRVLNKSFQESYLSIFGPHFPRGRPKK